MPFIVTLMHVVFLALFAQLLHGSLLCILSSNDGIDNCVFCLCLLVVCLAVGSALWGESNNIVGDVGAFLIPGLLFFSIGICGIPASLSIAGIGHRRINNIHTIYNQSCTTQNQPALSFLFGATSNGLGMTLKF